MGFKCGIVGLPNVGKSTLFNALTKASIGVSNYLFCTIEPNVGIVPVPDKRLNKIAKLINPKGTSPTTVKCPTTVKFIDIAGLIAGASKGEGLGNQFLAHIRETQAIIHVVRCFQDENIAHVSGSINSIADIKMLNTELALADLETIEKISVKLAKKAKRSDNRKEHDTYTLLEHFKKLLYEEVPIRSINLTEKEKVLLRPYQLLTSKPVLYVANVAEEGFGNNPYLNQVIKFADKEKAKVVPVCAAIEAEITNLDPSEQQQFLQILNLEEPSLHRIIRAGYELLGLITFFTAGLKEVRAWTCQKGSTALQAAGIIHTDFEKCFIRVEVISYDDYIQHNGEQRVKETGKRRLEGKEYIIRDGDIVYFRTRDR